MRMTPQSLRMSEHLDRRGHSLTDKERLSTRYDFLFTLSDRCTIQTRTVADDGAGGQAETWTDAYTSVPCRLAATGYTFGLGQERVFAGRLIHQADYLLIVAHDQAVNTTDRISAVAGPDGTVKDAGPFEVLAVGKVLSERTATQALLRRVS